MARGEKPPSKYCHRAKDHNRKATIHRWAQRKKAEKQTAQENFIDDVAMAGNRRELFFRVCRLKRLKADKAKEEKEMLAKTSLKDLIK